MSKLDVNARLLLDALAGRDFEMRQTLRRLVEINSGTDHVAGVTAMRHAVVGLLSDLADEVRIVPLPDREIVDDRGNVSHQPVADAVVLIKRGDAKRRVLLSGHLDTVYPENSAFQHIREVDSNTWNGPGVADLKGGLVVMVEALRAFESHPAASKIGWTVVLNTDEEVGSPSSTPLLHEQAKIHDFGLVYEPALADGRLAGARGGSANFDIVIHGKSAHVGREFEKGRSAIHVAAEVTGLLASLNQAEGVTINVGRIDGGGPVNQVADVAVVRMNVRVADFEKQEAIENDLRRLVAVLNRREGYSASLHGKFFSPPKPMTEPTTALFERVKQCGEQLGLEIQWSSTPTGGVCDGNKLQAVGLPTVDTLGVRGGNLHSPDEFVLLDSLVERSQLSALLLVSLAFSDTLA